jgi:hypothetical protein
MRLHEIHGAMTRAAACAIAAMSLAAVNAAQAAPQFQGSLTATAPVSVTILDPADIPASRPLSLGWIEASAGRATPAAALGPAAVLRMQTGGGQATMTLQGPPDTAYSLSRTLATGAEAGRPLADRDSGARAAALPTSGLQDLGWDETAKRRDEVFRGPQPAILTIIASYN